MQGKDLPLVQLSGTSLPTHKQTQHKHWQSIGHNTALYIQLEKLDKTGSSAGEVPRIIIYCPQFRNPKLCTFPFKVLSYGRAQLLQNGTSQSNILQFLLNLRKDWKPTVTRNQCFDSQYWPHTVYLIQSLLLTTIEGPQSVPHPQAVASFSRMQ